MSLSKTNLLEKAINQIIDNQVGMYKNAWQVADLEAETGFAAWLDSNVKMAKKFEGVAAFQLHLLAVDKRPDEHTILDQRTIAFFTQTTYPQQRAEIMQMFRWIRELEDATDVACVIVNLGEALQTALN